MHSCWWHEPAPFMDFHYFLSKNRLVSNYSIKTLLCLFGKHKYINGIFESDMNNYIYIYIYMNER